MFFLMTSHFTKTKFYKIFLAQKIRILLIGNPHIIFTEKNYDVYWTVDPTLLDQ